MRVRAVARYFEALSEGDPVAIGVTVFFLLLAAVVGGYTLKVRRDFRKEEEEKRKRWGLKDTKGKK